MMWSLPRASQYFQSQANGSGLISLARQMMTCAAGRNARPFLLDSARLPLSAANPRGVAVDLVGVGFLSRRFGLDRRQARLRA
jgi:hypothetical protein